MKRGLIFWDRKAWPEVEYRLRIERVKAAMRREALDAILIYGDANQSGDLAYLTHFIPYADTGVFVLPIQASPRLFTTHALRNMAWFKTITWVEDIVCTNHIGRECADYLGSLCGPRPRIGAVPARAFPYAVSRVVEERLSCRIMDFTDAYEEIRAIKSDRELSYIDMAGDIAVDVFRRLAARLHPGLSGFDIAADLERDARSRGAEDLFCFIQADGAAEGLSLPNAKPILRHATIELSVEYNGYWSKIGRTAALDGSFEAVSCGWDRFTEAYLDCLGRWRAGETARSFHEALRARWTEPVHFQVDYGLEPYWGAHAFKNEGGGEALRDHMALYLQASTVLQGHLRLLRTDTIAVKDSTPSLITRM